MVRNGEAGLTGSYAQVKNGQLFLNQVMIPPYAFGNRFNHDSLRTRRLLMHKREIRRLAGQVQQQGYSLIPVRVYLKDNRVKALLNPVELKRNPLARFVQHLQRLLCVELIVF